MIAKCEGQKASEIQGLIAGRLLDFDVDTNQQYKSIVIFPMEYDEVRLSQFKYNINKTFSFMKFWKISLNLQAENMVDET